MTETTAKDRDARTRESGARKSGGRESGGRDRAQRFDPAAMVVGGEHGLRAMVAAQEHLIERAVQLNHEIADFVERRLRHDRETLHSLARCRSPQDAMAVWARFLEAASRQYTEEMAVIANMGLDHAREAAEDARHEVEETVRPFAGPTPRRTGTGG